MNRNAIGLLTFLLAGNAAATEKVPTRWREGDLRGFPLIYDKDGRRLGKGTVTQRVHGNRLTTQSIYRYRDGRVTQERATFLLEPKLVQKTYSFQETRRGRWTRRFEVDFETGKAVARVREKDGDIDTKEKTLDVDAGEAFAGGGFVLAVKSLAPRLARGETRQLTAVAFTPKPRTVKVEIRHEGSDTIRGDHRTLRAERYVIHPKIPAIAKLFAKGRDSVIWLSGGTPPQVLRARTTLGTPDDPEVIVDTLGGQRASTVQATDRRRDRDDDRQRVRGRDDDDRKR